MKLLFVLFTLIAFTACQPEADDSVLANDADSIIGGSYVRANDPIAKSTVILLTFDPTSDSVSTGCTAIILTKNILLTAAHCVLDTKTHSKLLNPNIFMVSASNIIGKDGFDKSRMARVKAIKIPSKTKIDGYNTRYDLALVKIDRDVPADRVPVEFYNGPLIEGTRVVIAGFGKESVSTGMSQNMMLKVYNDYEISNHASTQITLAGPSGRGAFKGDSGGPGFIRVDGKLKLWGVSSLFFWQPDHKSIAGQARYEDLSYSRAWINETIKNFSSDSTTTLR